MEVIVNREKIPIFKFDNVKSIIERYSLRKKHSLPSYFRPKIEINEIENGTKIVLMSVIDALTNTSLEELIDEFLYIKLSEDYGIKKNDVIILWTLGRQLDEKEFQKLKMADRSIFTSQQRLSELQKEYKVSVKEQRKWLKQNLRKQSKIFEELINVKVDLDHDNFFLEKINSTTIVVTQGETLLDIFDSIDTSVKIPFVVLNHKGKLYYKIFKNITPPDPWIHDEYEDEGIYFRILNSHESKLNSKQYFLENLYSSGFWKNEQNNTNTITINLHIRDRSVLEIDLRKEIIKCLGDRVRCEVISSRQTGIKGSFSIFNVNINKFIFSDFVLNNDIFSYFMFCNERQKTITEKNKFYIYFKPQQNTQYSDTVALEMKTSASVTIITSVLENNITVNKIKIGKIQNSGQAKSIINIFLRLVGIYLRDYDKIFELYNTYVRQFAKRTDTQKKKKVKQDNKVGKRLKLLTRIRPDIFVKGYSSQCQQKRQPYIVKENEVEELKEKLGSEHKLLKFEDNWYACEPREEDDKDMGNIWPGLSVNMKMPKVKDKYPYVPCCFTVDQYIKKGSYLNKSQRGESKNTQSKDYIVSSNRMLEPERVGYLPSTWDKIFNMTNLKKIKKKRQEFYPFLRYGVLKRPDSFIHCLERAFNPRYDRSIYENKLQLVRDAKYLMCKQGLSVGKQELFDMSDANIIMSLQSDDQYLDPGKYVSLAQKYYKCNIMIFVISEKIQESDIVIPRSSQSYLMRHFNKEQDTVFIVKYETSFGLPYPYQCELVCKLDKKEIKTSFEYTDFTKLFEKLYKNSNEILIVDIIGTAKYKIIETNNINIK